MPIKLLPFALGIMYLITTLANNHNTSKFTRVICTVPERDEFIANYSCRARPINRNTTVLNIRAYLYRQADAITVYIRLYKKLNGYKPFLINVKEDFCDFFSRKSGVPYTKLMMRVGAPYTNVNHTCPYIGELFVRNAAMDASKLLDFWPSGEYRADFILVVNDRQSPTLTIQIYFEIGEKLFG